jgi:cytochrome c-type biogenesis protein CcmH/NrfG
LTLIGASYRLKHALDLDGVEQVDRVDLVLAQQDLGPWLSNQPLTPALSPGERGDRAAVSEGSPATHSVSSIQSKPVQSVKKETIITAAVFFTIGSLAGYIVVEHNASSSQQGAVASTATAGGSAQSDPNASQGQNPSLPKGHPPVDDTAVVKLLQEEAEQDPRSPGPALKLANYLYDRQRFEQAITWYQKAVALDPGNVNALTDLGTSYYNTGRYQEALREFRSSLEINPKHEQTLFNSIIVNLQGIHDLPAAQQAWDRLHALNPNYPGLDRLKQNIDAARGSASDSK